MVEEQGIYDEIIWREGFMLCIYVLDDDSFSVIRGIIEMTLESFKTLRKIWI